MRYDSLIDPAKELFIDENNWVVGILRKPDGRNPEHAFLMVEGVNAYGQIQLIRYDLVKVGRETGPFTIRIKEKVIAPDKVRETFLELLNHEEIVGKCWSISKTQAQTLHAHALDSQQNPDRYNLLGDSAVLPKTADSARAVDPETAEATSNQLVQGMRAVSHPAKAALVQEALNPSGHNCFTWARSILYSLKDKRIQRGLPKSPVDLIASVTSRHLQAAESGSIPESSCRII